MPATPDPTPSEKQLEVLEHIIGFVQDHGYQPNKNEMAAHFGVTRNAIAARLAELQQRGVVEVLGERAIKLKYVRFTAVYDETVDCPDRPSPRPKKPGK